jgi:hypothetical protein
MALFKRFSILKKTLVEMFKPVNVLFQRLFYLNQRRALFNSVIKALFAFSWFTSVRGVRAIITQSQPPAISGKNWRTDSRSKRLALFLLTALPMRLLVMYPNRLYSRSLGIADRIISGCAHEFRPARTLLKSDDRLSRFLRSMAAGKHGLPLEILGVPVNFFNVVAFDSELMPPLFNPRF